MTNWFRSQFQSGLVITRLSGRFTLQVTVIRPLFEVDNGVAGTAVSENLLAIQQSFDGI